MCPVCLSHRPENLERTRACRKDWSRLDCCDQTERSLKPRIQHTHMNLLPPTQGHYWVDNLDPWAIHFSEKFGIRWYGLSYAAGILFAAWLFSRWARQGRLPVPVDQVPTLITCSAFGVLAGGRLGYCIFYNAQDVMRHPLEVFAVWHGQSWRHPRPRSRALGIRTPTPRRSLTTTRCRRSRWPSRHRLRTYHQLHQWRALGTTCDCPVVCCLSSSSTDPRC